MSSTPSRPLWQGRALALVGIVLFAFSLRSAVASLSPVLAFIAADFPMPPAIIGLIGTVPPVCYAVFGILTPQLERRFGLERLARRRDGRRRRRADLAGARQRLDHAAARDGRDLRRGRRRQHPAAAAGQEVLPRSHRAHDDDLFDDHGPRDAHAAARRGAGGGCRGLARLAGALGRVRASSR